MFIELCCVHTTSKVASGAQAGGSRADRGRLPYTLHGRRPRVPLRRQLAGRAGRVRAGVEQDRVQSMKPRNSSSGRSATAFLEAIDPTTRRKTAPGFPPLWGQEADRLKF